MYIEICLVNTAFIHAYTTHICNIGCLLGEIAEEEDAETRPLEWAEVKLAPDSDAAANDFRR